jgi:long-subunit acyl-CoA synthetase (AMP-forming)
MNGGNPCRPGEVGEVLVRGDSVMAGYWRNPATAAAACATAGCSPVTWVAWTPTAS